jgi:hypothetical protein
MEDTKKVIGDIKRLKWINVNALTVKNSIDNIRYYRIPMMVSNYIPPVGCPEYIRGETLSLSFHLEESQYKKVEEQIKKHIKEISIWLVDDEIIQLRDFLNSIDFSKK